MTDYRYQVEPIKATSFSLINEWIYLAATSLTIRSGVYRVTSVSIGLDTIGVNLKTGVTVYVNRSKCRLLVADLPF